MADVRSSQIERIKSLRQKRPGVQKLQVLGVVVQPLYGFHLACSNAKPIAKAVIRQSPVQSHQAVSELAHVTDIGLGSDAKSRRQLRGEIQAAVGQGEAA